MITYGIDLDQLFLYQVMIMITLYKYIKIN
jgi:hypothetical protein